MKTLRQRSLRGFAALFAELAFVGTDAAVMRFRSQLTGDARYPREDCSQTMQRRDSMLTRSRMPKS